MTIAPTPPRRGTSHGSPPSSPTAIGTHCSTPSSPGNMKNGLGKCFACRGVVKRKRSCYFCSSDCCFCDSCVIVTRIIAVHGVLRPIPICVICIERRKDDLWVADSFRRACGCCGSTFRFFRRRHHCRRCGEVVCSSCSASEQPIPVLFPAPEIVSARVCSTCSSLPPLVPVGQVALASVPVTPSRLRDYSQLFHLDEDTGSWVDFRGAISDRVRDRREGADRSPAPVPAEVAAIEAQEKQDRSEE